jgi:hypothetical protein
VADPVSEAWVNQINKGELIKGSVTTKHKEGAKKADLYQKLFKGAGIIFFNFSTPCI